MTNPLRDHPAVAANKDYMYSESGVMHCLLAMERGGSDGLLIESEGYDFPRYAAFVPGIRDIVNAAMDRAADYIIRQGIEKSGARSRCICFEELEEHLGLTIQEDSGLDNMLQAALERRPETASVDMSDGGITFPHPAPQARPGEGESRLCPTHRPCGSAAGVCLSSKEMHRPPSHPGLHRSWPSVRG